MCLILAVQTVKLDFSFTKFHKVQCWVQPAVPWQLIAKGRIVGTEEGLHNLLKLEEAANSRIRLFLYFVTLSEYLKRGFRNEGPGTSHRTL